MHAKSSVYRIGRTARFRLCTCIFLMVIMCMACFPDTQEPSSLIGRWEVVQATRNNRPTSTLKDAFFDFKSDSIMVTNILREQMEFIYHREGDLIAQKGPMPIEYKLVELMEDSLVLTSTINNYYFEFFLKRHPHADSLKQEL